MGKKIKPVLDLLKPKFIERGEKKGYDSKVLEKIWSDWERFAEYAFNKSHATCYAKIAYQTAYLKAHHPAEFMAAVLTNNLSDITEITKFMDECKSQGIKVLPPSVNESDITFTVNKEGNVRFGLAAVKGVGMAAVENILKTRDEAPFTDIFDFVCRVNLTSVNRRTIESLVKAGGFDEFEDIKREQFFAENDRKEQFIDVLIKYGNLVQLDNASTANSLFGDSHKQNIKQPDIPTAEDWPVMEKLGYEKDLIGMFLSFHPLDPFRFEIDKLCNIKLSDLSDLASIRNKKLIFAGIVVSADERLSKNGRPYGRVTIEDYAGSHSMQLFGNEWVKYKNLFTVNYFLFFQAKVKERQAYYNNGGGNNNDTSSTPQYDLVFSDIMMLQDVRENLINGLSVFLPVDSINQELIERLIKALKKNKGKKTIEFEIFDTEEGVRINQKSRAYQIKITDSLLAFFDEELIRYIIKKSV